MREPACNRDMASFSTSYFVLDLGSLWDLASILDFTILSKPPSLR